GIRDRTVTGVQTCALPIYWRDNLFEIFMTRLELAAPHKIAYAAIPRELGQAPREVPAFAGQFFRTMHNMLVLAKAPASPVHVAEIGRASCREGGWRSVLGA